MADKAWTDKSEYKQLSHELRALSRDAFADRVLELLRIRWPECIAAPRLRTIDRQGVDLYVWNELAVQCKGFEVAEVRIGRSQADQWIASIDKFAISDVETPLYLLIHNRDGRDAEFRIPVEERIAQLQARGRVARAELWDVQRLLREVFNGMTTRIVAALETTTGRDLASFEPFDVAPVEVVPVRVSRLVIDRHRLESQDSPERIVADPAELLFGAEAPNLTLLLGEAGYGKTTTARRAVQGASRKVFFVPAARIDHRVVGTKDLLERCIDIDDLLHVADVGNVERWRFVARPVLENLLKDERTNAILLVDGLDESPFLARERGAFQHFFNFFNYIRVPVVLTARTEFWTERRHDLEQRFGKVGAHKGGIRKYVRQAELIEWDTNEMTELARRFRERLDTPDARQRIDELIRALQTGAYETFYGDIPRRPLFLRMILDTVAEHDVHHVRRSDLIAEWAALKVARDAGESQRWGTSGRLGIANETAVRDTIALSFEAMEVAARLMTEVHGGRLVLLPLCDLRGVVERLPPLAGSADPTGLLLNSLLVPVETRLAEPQRVRFSHRLFQEYFLARHLARQPDELRGVGLPSETESFLREMQ